MKCCCTRGGKPLRNVAGCWREETVRLPRFIRLPTRWPAPPSTKLRRELFQLFRTIREAGLEHLGQYHSHLASENAPSPSDIEQAGYPEHVYFIVSPRPDARKPVRAFSIRDGLVTEVEIIAVS